MVLDLNSRLMEREELRPPAAIHDAIALESNATASPDVTAVGDSESAVLTVERLESWR